VVLHFTVRGLHLLSAGPPAAVTLESQAQAESSLRRVKISTGFTMDPDGTRSVGVTSAFHRRVSSVLLSFTLEYPHVSSSAQACHVRVAASVWAGRQVAVGFQPKASRSKEQHSTPLLSHRAMARAKMQLNSKPARSASGHSPISILLPVVLDSAAIKAQIHSIPPQSPSNT